LQETLLGCSTFSKESCSDAINNSQTEIQNMTQLEQPLQAKQLEDNCVNNYRDKLQLLEQENQILKSKVIEQQTAHMHAMDLLERQLHLVEANHVSMTTATNRNYELLKSKYEMEVLEKNIMKDNLEVLEAQLTDTKRAFDQMKLYLHKFIESTTTTISSTYTSTGTVAIPGSESRRNLSNLKTLVENLHHNLQDTMDLCVLDKNHSHDWNAFTICTSFNSADATSHSDTIDYEYYPNHHPGRYVALRDGLLFNKTSKHWECCQKKDVAAVGCQTGFFRHHPTIGTLTFDKSYRWNCCSSYSRSEKGCKAGPHPAPFERLDRQNSIFHFIAREGGSDHTDSGKDSRGQKQRSQSTVSPPISLASVVSSADASGSGSAAHAKGRMDSTVSMTSSMVPLAVTGTNVAGLTQRLSSPGMISENKNILCIQNNLLMSPEFLIA